jgi:hypothetical protein
MVDAVNHEHAYRSDIGLTNLVRLLLFAFVAVCVFDPADQVFGVKVWLFVAVWVAAPIAAFSAPAKIWLPTGLLLCVLLFITVPLLSIVWYYLTNGTEPYAGFALMKGFLLVSVAIVLVANRLDVLPFFSAILTVLASMTIVIVVSLQFAPELFSVLKNIGSQTGLVLLGERSYADESSFMFVNVVTSPLLVISIAYYFDRAMSAAAIRSKVIYGSLTAISIVAMLSVGSRNEAAVSLLLPFFLWPLYTRRIARNECISLVLLAALSVPFIGKLRVLLNPAEFSNNIKLTLLGDYAEIFSKPLTLLFGQGLGAYYPWTISGRPKFELTGENFYFNTELTYAELVRYSGLLGALVVMALLLFPVANGVFGSTNARRRALGLGFMAYLCMSATNPMLFSSTGMLCFSVLLAETFGSSERSTNWMG